MKGHEPIASAQKVPGRAGTPPPGPPQHLQVGVARAPGPAKYLMARLRIFTPGVGQEGRVLAPRAACPGLQCASDGSARRMDRYGPIQMCGRFRSV